MTITATPIHYATAEGAKSAHMHGWNLRCNLCGTYGAQWIPGERPGWGDLALCPTHGQDLHDEHRRHAASLAELRCINFEQDSALRPYQSEGW